MQELSAYMISRQIKEMLPESVREYHRYLRWYRLRLHSSYGPAPNSDAFARARTFRGVSGYARNLEQTRPSFQMRLPVDQGVFWNCEWVAPEIARADRDALRNQAYRFDVAPVRRLSSEGRLLAQRRRPDRGSEGRISTRPGRSWLALRESAVGP